MCVCGGGGGGGRGWGIIIILVYEYLLKMGLFLLERVTSHDRLFSLRVVPFDKGGKYFLA